MGTAVSYCSYFAQDAPVILGEPILLMQLEQVHDRAKLSHDMLAGENARNKSVRYECLPKVAPANLYEGQVSDAVKLREELLDEIIEKMQHDTLSIFKQKFPQGKRNDSRTDLRIMESVSSHLVDVGWVASVGDESTDHRSSDHAFPRPRDRGGSDPWIY
ncbi:uncharacterized protein VDAG_01168 [Verticillium dahliae VdLs.17]|uniref:Uncharacterized protein n=1 Tax=Verticillium dahliae (strain VdLs.17 / ATCC MYA-4575 / FGSC 10137) TaxID=498257 RepID=G2WTP5_VERDV|nr:uncharacterized protein VDAG_01168 [Verticillium dahliae VdLs.17]EGY17486.1 hypothetical protein VDAG_01168 [Verticillium dahliae VdLs.17]